MAVYIFLTFVSLLIFSNECALNVSDNINVNCFKEEYAKIPRREQRALSDLWSSTNGDSWITKWIIDTDTKYCSLHGVCCKGGDNDDIYHVVEINLASNNLSGTITSNIANISHLGSIHFNNNSISGTIPSSLSRLDYLLNLNLANNLMYGTIDNIACSKYSRLIALNLNNNRFIGNNSLQLLTHCPYLQLLYLSHNQFNGTIPKNISLLVNLSFLDISNNYFHGIIPSNLSRLTNLKLLSLSNLPEIKGNLSQLLPSFTNLNYLIISNAINIYGNLDWICYTKNITLLQVSKTNVAGVIPTCFENLHQLQVLDLSRNNQIEGGLPSVSRSDNLTLG